MKPVLHYVKDLNQIFIRDYIRNHRIHIIQEWTAEYTTLIGKLLKSFESLRIMDFYAGTAMTRTSLIRGSLNFSISWREICSIWRILLI